MRRLTRFALVSSLGAAALIGAPALLAPHSVAERFLPAAHAVGGACDEGDNFVGLTQAGGKTYAVCETLEGDIYLVPWGD